MAFSALSGFLAMTASNTALCKGKAALGASLRAVEISKLVRSKAPKALLI